MGLRGLTSSGQTPQPLSSKTHQPIAPSAAHAAPCFSTAALPWSSPAVAQSLPDQGLMALLIIFSLLGIVSLVLLYRLKLIVEVHPERFWIWFDPLSSRPIPGAQRAMP